MAILEKDPNLFYRYVRGNAPIDDFYNTGQIRGTPRYNYGAYFLKGNALTPNSGGGAYVIVDPKKLNIPENSLYPYEGRNVLFDAPDRIPAKINPKFGYVESSGDKYGHPVLNPKENPSFIDTVNPQNRKGIKIVTDEGKVLYDRITPLVERPISTHARNIATEAKVIGGQQVPHAGKALGAAGALYQMARQYQAATGQLGDSYWDKEYGESDPLALRPLYDAILGNAAFEKTINNPEWVERNPLAAAIYGAALGGNEYSSAFVDAYVPEFLKEKGKESLKAEKKEYSPVSQPMR